MPKKAATKKVATNRAREPELRPVSREAISGVDGETSFIEFLRRELEWPIPYEVQRMEDVAIPHDLQSDFGFEPEENRIRVSRLLNLTEDQPWGVFLFEFETARPYLSHLRKLLRALGSRRTLQRGDPIWDRNDLIFICTQDWCSFEFVHFSGEKPESAVISTFGWKGPDDAFLHTLCRHNLPRLRMPEPETDNIYDTEKWRSAWREAFNIKPVTDAFYATLKEVFNAIQSGVKGLEGEDLRFFSVLLLNRLVFLKFVEKKGWLAGDTDYLWNKFQEYGQKRFWTDFLFHFFFSGLNCDPSSRTPNTQALLGDVPFLNAELFALSNRWDDTTVEIDNRVFDLLFDKLLNPFNFTVCETSPLEVEVAFNQDLLGYGYEELIADQHGQGAYYTQPAEVNLMCRESLRAFLETRCEGTDKDLIGRLVYGELTEADAVPEADALALYNALHEVTVVDPALGSGTFPVAMMKHLLQNLRTLGERLVDSKAFQSKIKASELTDPADAFALKLHIIERSLYGCDIDYFAVQIAKLRFWIELMVDCEEPIPLPNLRCKLVVGDALVSALGTNAKGNVITLEGLLGHPTKGQMPLQKDMVDDLAQTKIAYYREKDANRLRELEKEIDAKREALLGQLGVDLASLKRTDKHVLWQIDFAEIFTGKNPGFDIAIANPPYLRQELIDEAFAEFNLLTTKKLLIKLYDEILKSRISGQSDLYLFFFFRYYMLTKSSYGISCSICSNSWLDVSYGKELQLQVAKNSTIRFILENQSVKSFENADINTTLNLFLNRGNAEDCCALFIVISKFNEKINYNIQKVDVNSPEEARYLTIENKHLIQDIENDLETGKWGAQYLKSPDFFIDLIKLHKDCFVKISDIAELKRGITTGNNSFFIISRRRLEGLNIDERYLAPVLSTMRDCSAIFVQENELSNCIFVCADSQDYLMRNGFNSTLNYINEFSSTTMTKKGKHTKEGMVSVESSTLKARNQWWTLNDSKGGDAVIPRLIRERFFILDYESERIRSSDMFFDICFKDEKNKEILVALLNSIFTYMNIEILGRLNVGGRLNIYGPEIKRLKIPNPHFFMGEVGTHLLQVFEPVKCRPVRPILEELKMPDRIMFDMYVLTVLGIDRFYDDLISFFSTSVLKRLGRERNIEIIE